MASDSQFDLVVSLGGNCAAAQQLCYKFFRTEAYPFDWTYFTSDEAVYQLIQGFKDDFKDYALKENFEELPANPSHPDRIQYKDNYAKIVWANHFYYGKDDYYCVKEKLNRRFKRLVNSVKKSHSILFVFSVSFKIEPDSFVALMSALNNLYPDKLFKIKVCSFDAGGDCEYKNNDVEIFYYKRMMNSSDFDTTNNDWNFLDNINSWARKVARVRYRITKRLIKLIPVKKIRHKLKRKYHV